MPPKHVEKASTSTGVDVGVSSDTISLQQSQVCFCLLFGL